MGDSSNNKFKKWGAMPVFQRRVAAFFESDG